MDRVLQECRALMRTTVPIPVDCGQLCGKACCSSLPGEESGMLLFPGEEKLFENRKGYRVEKTDAGMLCFCGGRCARAGRPLACMLFPLLPLWRDGKVTVEKDLRAAAVCPLSHLEMEDFNTAFTETVKAVGERLAQDPAQLRFLQFLTRQQDELRRIRQLFLGNR